MRLLEFFGRSLDSKKSSDKESDKFSKDDLFWFIVDDDHLYKEHFFPIARKLKIKEQFSSEEIVKEFLPMVNKGCLEFINKQRLTGKPSKLFPKELREEMCQKLYDHYRDDIIKDQYSLGS